MGVSLSKGGNVSLAKSGIDQAAQAATAAGDHAAASALTQLANTGLVNAIVGLGWDARTTTGTDFDLDASAIAVKADGKVLSDAHFVFFNNLKSPDGSIEHLGDNLTGLGEGDDEQVKVHLGNVPAEVEKIVFPVSIYDGDNRGQNFGQVRNAFIRVFDADSGAEVARYDLSEDAATETAMVFGELYRNGADWKFRAVGQGYASGLRGIAADFAVNL